MKINKKLFVIANKKIAEVISIILIKLTKGKTVNFLID